MGRSLKLHKVHLLIQWEMHFMLYMCDSFVDDLERCKNVVLALKYSLVCSCCGNIVWELYSSLWILCLALVVYVK